MSSLQAKKFETGPRNYDIEKIAQFGTDYTKEYFLWSPIQLDAVCIWAKNPNNPR
jgi:hypothetical protein